ncbi:hypothetical protein Mgra_00002468 [Meloidogyne graminicola]|uniref:G-protein coupled receptors family 1 profile domain-containing protein n=1 Tax=Meloidogyne graminicola TaxID=189291 RepID=A0A8S9ZXX3_9BILA|nr:hypothetical protein Mgra_00002468 [Meloidogyne graminicola]
MEGKAEEKKNKKIHVNNISFQFSLIFGSLIGGVTIIGLIANILVVIAILSDKKMRKSSMNLLLLNLAIADLLYLLAFTPFWLSMSIYGDVGWHFSDMFCPIARFLGNIFLVISILTYLAICIERYIAIVHPIAMHTSVWCTRSRVLVVAFGIWVFAMAYQFPYLVVFNVFTLPDKQMRVCRNPLASKSKLWKIYKWSEFLLTYVLPIVISVLLYSRICRVLWSTKGKNVKENKTELKSNKYPNGRTIKKLLETRFKEAISDVQRNTSSKMKVAPKEKVFHSFSNSEKIKNNQLMNIVSSANLNARRSVVKMLMLCVALFFLCYTPMVAYFCIIWSSTSITLLNFALVQFQSSFNPFLYTLFATQFREKLSRLFWICLKQKRNNNLITRHKISEKSTSTFSSVFGILKEINIFEMTMDTFVNEINESSIISGHNTSIKPGLTNKMTSFYECCAAKSIKTIVES